MTSKVYVEILKAMIKPQLDAGKDFILEEDGDTSHGGDKAAKTNIARIWKEDHPKLEHYTNAPHSPDLAPVERMWLFMEEKVNAQDHFDEATLMRLCEEAWESIPQATIDRICGEWYDGLIKVIWRGGKMSGY